MECTYAEGLLAIQDWVIKLVRVKNKLLSFPHVAILGASLTSICILLFSFVCCCFFFLLFIACKLLCQPIYLLGFILLYINLNLGMMPYIKILMSWCRYISVLMLIGKLLSWAWMCEKTWRGSYWAGVQGWIPSLTLSLFASVTKLLLGRAKPEPLRRWCWPEVAEGRHWSSVG
jgi:hypothetical protein